MRRKRVRRQLPTKNASDLGTPERWQHDSVVVERIKSSRPNEVPRAKVCSCNPLETYFRRNVIDYKQKSVGKVLGRLWQNASIEPRVVARYEEYVDTQSAGNAIVRRSESYEKWRAAIAVVGPIASDEVVSIHREEEEVLGPARIEILRWGLDVLAKHFGV